MEILADMGFMKLDDIIGRTDKLLFNEAVANWKTKGLDFSKLFYSPKKSKDVEVFNTRKQEHNIYKIIDRKFIKRFGKLYKTGSKLIFDYKVNNTDRSLGAMFSGYLAKKFGHEGLKEDTVRINLIGTAGQSFGAFATYGVTLNLEGEGNDYVGKGLSGAKIFIKPHRKSKVVPEKSIIVGNTVLFNKKVTTTDNTVFGGANTTITSNVTINNTNTYIVGAQITSTSNVSLTGANIHIVSTAVDITSNTLISGDLTIDSGNVVTTSNVSVTSSNVGIGLIFAPFKAAATEVAAACDATSLDEGDVPPVA